MIDNVRNWFHVILVIYTNCFIANLVGGGEYWQYSNILCDNYLKRDNFEIRNPFLSIFMSYFNYIVPKLLPKSIYTLLLMKKAAILPNFPSEPRKFPAIFNSFQLFHNFPQLVEPFPEFYAIFHNYQNNFETFHNGGCS